ncbi:winged helix-turn-helix domain-containing protein [Bifidobacterium leontopitheci]|uniref:ArsR family transcriptional regulator n=1 Tax=Bifidobacterium leontopitheci TaxID=2650774 RepID=A0A6I1GBG3_9BIFI|nr:helix-turn-helix domain-containing protein [Bifidobacterium leontopitheci]KAB7788984.1 ArsR family transcriptional regulator [Bifidobacterium leontopitheci]
MAEFVWGDAPFDEHEGAVPANDGCVRRVGGAAATGTRRDAGHGLDGGSGDSGESASGGSRGSTLYDRLPDVFYVRDRHVRRVISHPVRYAALDVMYQCMTPMTASAIARVVGVSPSAMSYHLRQLEKVGIVHRVAQWGDGRE